MSRRDDPFLNAKVVTPNDTTDLTIPARSLYIGGAGDVVVITGAGDATFKAAPAGFILEVAPIRVKATGTTATDIVALW